MDTKGDVLDGANLLIFKGFYTNMAPPKKKETYNLQKLIAFIKKLITPQHVRGLSF